MADTVNALEEYKLYDGEVTLLFDKDKHTYTVGDKVVEGATGVTGVIAKPALVPWAVNQAILHLNKTIKPGVAYDELQLRDIFDEAKKAHRQKSTYAADVGTLAHEAIERFIKEGDRTPPFNEEAKKAFISFVKWADDNKVEFLESERKIYSKQYEYAGTMDFVCKIEGELLVGDTKTSSAIYEEYWFQTAGYQQAYVEEMGADVKGRVIVRVGKDGSFEVQFKKDEVDYIADRDAFNGALVLYKRLQALKNKQLVLV